MLTRFFASQSIDLYVPDLAIPVQHYLRQPQRLARTLIDPSRVSILEDTLFRLKMRPIKFLMLNIQPTVDLRLEALADGSIILRSESYEMKGIEQFNQWFQLSLEGVLAPTLVYGKTYLQGKADLAVHVEIPPILWVTPQPLIERTGNGILKSILLTIKQRLNHQLLADYRAWVDAQTQSMNQFPAHTEETQRAPERSATS